jgi:hypothetical protein
VLVAVAGKVFAEAGLFSVQSSPKEAHKRFIQTGLYPMLGTTRHRQPGFSICAVLWSALDMLDWFQAPALRISAIR